MIDELINLLIDLAVNPDLDVSEETLDGYHIADDKLRSALLNKDKHALMQFLDPKHLMATMTNNTAIYVISGKIDTKPSASAADVTFVLEPQTSFQLTLTHKYRSDIKYSARVLNGELDARLDSPSSEEAGPEGDVPSPPPAYQS